MGLRNFKKKATQDDLAAARARVVNEAVTVDWGVVKHLAPLSPEPPAEAPQLDRSPNVDEEKCRRLDAYLAYFVHVGKISLPSRPSGTQVRSLLALSLRFADHRSFIRQVLGSDGGQAGPSAPQEKKKTTERVMAVQKPVSRLSFSAGYFADIHS